MLKRIFSYELEIMVSLQKNLGSCLEYDVNIPTSIGNQIEVKLMPSVMDCQRFCETTTNCSFFTFLSKGGLCKLKSSDEGRMYAPPPNLKAVISGPKYCPRKGDFLIETYIFIQRKLFQRLFRF